MLNSLILAQLLPSGPSLWLGVIAIAIVVLFFPTVVLLATRYKRCPSNRVLVIFGMGAKGVAATTKHGGAAFVYPLIQDYKWLSLEPIQIEVPLRGALSMENIRVNVPSVFTVAVGTNPEVMQNAAIRLLGLNTVEIKKQAEDIIFGQLRQVIASMRIEDINRDREKFLESILTSLEPELKKIGLVLINVNITDITDESGYIEAIGQKAASQAVQQARADVAEQTKLGEVRVAEAERDQAISVADATKNREVGTRGAMREQAVRIAELEKEQSIGEQAAAYERDAQIKDAEREMRVRLADADAKAVLGEKQASFERDAHVKDAERAMRIRLADADAKAIRGENESKADVAASEADLAVRRAEAYQLGETKKREAEAAVLEAQNVAMAKAALAEASKIEAERRAELEAPAKAQKAKTIVEAQAAGEKRRIEAEAEAAAIFVKLEAEARGQYEILAKKGEGLKNIIDACGGSKEAFQMLMLEHLDDLTNASAQAISKIKFDKIIVWENGGQNGQTSTSNFLQGMARTLPPMMQVLKDIGGVEMPESLVRFADGDGAATAAAASQTSDDSPESGSVA